MFQSDQVRGCSGGDGIADNCRRSTWTVGAEILRFVSIVRYTMAYLVAVTVVLTMMGSFKMVVLDDK